MTSIGKHTQLLARVNFPLYAVHCLTERHVLVAGGGGGSKTGISNVIEIYELINNGSTCRAESVTRYETGSVAIMNCTVYNAGKFIILFAGMEGKCQLYKIKYGACDGVCEREFSEVTNDTSTKLRKKFHTESIPTLEPKVDHECANSSSPPSHYCFTISPVDSFQTDFSEEPFQKLVRFSSIAKCLATAGSDGCIRIWKYPKMNILHEIQAHDDDVDDIDICPLGKKIASVSRDGHGKVWNIENGKLISHLSYTLPSKSSRGKYIFRSCRFGVDQENKSLFLFTTLNPAVRSKPPSPTFLCKWKSENFLMEKIVKVGTDMLSTMAISEDGIFLGLGTQDGSVKLYIAFSLQLLYKVDHVHGIFVTGLQFLHSCEESQRITGGHEASLISISVDNHINIHHVPIRGTMGMLTLITLFLLILLCIFVAMDYFNL